MRTCHALLCFSALGCEPMDARGNPFAAAPRATSAAAEAAAPFDFPSEPPLIITSEQMADGDGPASLAAAAGVDPTTLADEPSSVAPSSVAPSSVAPAAPSPSLSAALPGSTGWPVRLVSTLPNAQPPRAILGLPDGEERVVSPGSILAEQGLVVMMVTANRVQLARIEAAGDHARIESFELSAQYLTP